MKVRCHTSALLPKVKKRKQDTLTMFNLWKNQTGKSIKKIPPNEDFSEFKKHHTIFIWYLSF